MKDPWYLSLLPWKLPRSHPVGAALTNLGNTCYLNAVLQCLTHTVPLLLKLRSAACSGGAAFCSLCALKHHIDRCISMSGGAISPADFADNLPNLSPYLQPGRQEDAHEFLQCLLYSLHTCCGDCGGDSIVEQVFGGSLRSRLQCPDCGHHSDKIEPLCDISLEINDADSLTDALQSFTRVERIGDLEATLICDECGARGCIEKQLKLDRAPLVMVFHLKRFKNCGPSTYKIDQFVKYPLELQLAPYLSYAEDEEGSRYELYAIVVHEGSPEEGHYYCTIRSSPITWYRMNDCKVSEVSEAIALSQKAYILFYIRRGSSPWFSSFLESQKSCQMRYGTDASEVSLLDLADERPLLSGASTCSRSRGVLLKDSNLSVETGYVASPRRLDTGGLMAERGCYSSPRREVGGLMAERGYTSTPRRAEIGGLMSETVYAASPRRADIGGLMAERGYAASPHRADTGLLMAERGYAASPRRAEVGGLMAERGYCSSPRRADIGGLMAERGYSASPRRADTGGLMADRGYAASPRRADIDRLKAERGYTASPRRANIETFKAERGYVASPRRSEVVSGNALAYREMTQATKQYSPDHVIDILHDEFADKAFQSRIMFKKLSFLHSEQLVDMSALVYFTVTSSLLRFILYVSALFRRLLDVQP